MFIHKNIPRSPQQKRARKVIPPSLPDAACTLVSRRAYVLAGHSVI